ncbi:acylneuraminate cytidylyltransferase family protein [Polynucleobacter paneuropaeus]|nr:acylneuraminate cytidylyltransferase family protein [Polynucleobacter paneuropaeus]
MTIVAFIFARGGSKGLPGKNIRPLGGKPLIAWSIEQALSVNRISKVVVSTDSAEIANIALAYGAEVPFLRPAELASDTSPEWESWRHALSFLKERDGTLPKIMVSLPATAPLRAISDIDQCIDEYLSSKVDAVITVTEAYRSPYFNMVKKNANGTVDLVITSEKVISRRQDVPEVFDIATVAYVLNPIFVMNKKSLFEGAIKAVQVPIERAIDIDTLNDFELAEYRLQKLRKSA